MRAELRRLCRNPGVQWEFWAFWRAAVLIGGISVISNLIWGISPWPVFGFMLAGTVVFYAGFRTGSRLVMRLLRRRR